MCQAIPAKVVEVVEDEWSSRAMVEVMGVRRHIDTGLLRDDLPKSGEWVLVHVGFAMSKISGERGSISYVSCRCWGRMRQLGRS